MHQRASVWPATTPGEGTCGEQKGYLQMGQEFVDNFRLAQAGKYPGWEISALGDRNTSQELRITVEFNYSVSEYQ